jgi:hypothetical protein
LEPRPVVSEEPVRAAPVAEKSELQQILDRVFPAGELDDLLLGRGGLKLELASAGDLTGNAVASITHGKSRPSTDGDEPEDLAVMRVNPDRLLDASVPLDIRASDFRTWVRHERTHHRLENLIRRQFNAYQRRRLNASRALDVLHEVMAYAGTLKDMEEALAEHPGDEVFAEHYRVRQRNIGLLLRMATGIDDILEIRAAADRDDLPTILNWIQAVQTLNRGKITRAQAELINLPAEKILNLTQQHRIVLAGELGVVWKELIENVEAFVPYSAVVEYAAAPEQLPAAGAWNGHVSVMVDVGDPLSGSVRDGVGKKWFGLTGTHREDLRRVLDQLRFAEWLAYLGVDADFSRDMRIDKNEMMDAESKAEEYREAMLIAETVRKSA